jgi:Glycolipid transfer protein (GLTP)
LSPVIYTWTNALIWTFRDCSLKDAATTAYGQVCAPFHNWAVRKAVGAGMHALPTRDQLVSRLNETGKLLRLLLFEQINIQSTSFLAQLCSFYRFLLYFSILGIELHYPFYFQLKI